MDVIVMNGLNLLSSLEYKIIVNFVNTVYFIEENNILKLNIMYFYFFQYFYHY